MALFTPVYDETVRETNTISGATFPVSQMYALSPFSAKLLAAGLGDLAPTIELRNPWPTYGPLIFNHGVPWLIFPGGVERNAALLAYWWTLEQTGTIPHGTAESYCRKDIAGEI